MSDNKTDDAMVTFPKKFPVWLFGVLRYIVGLIIALTVAYETLATKDYVADSIKAHEERTETQRREDVRSIKEGVNDLKKTIENLDNRQWDLDHAHRK
jgi:uncharacterized protein YlxW (UPF0749 family)